MGATGAVLLALFKRYLDGNPGRINAAMLRSAIEATAKLSSFVVFILIGARIFSLTFYGVNGHIWVEHLLTSLPGGQLGFLIFVNVLVFFLAFFLDLFEIAFIIIPLLVPARRSQPIQRPNPAGIRRTSRRLVDAALGILGGLRGAFRDERLGGGRVPPLSRPRA
jgi:TRAP-type mannitol/chloroaromatic compound transport system permease large subunit